MAEAALTPRTRRNAALAVRRPAPGRYLALEDGDETVLIPLAEDLVRIGRSVSAHIALEDGAASRRHALIVNGPAGVELVDDGSLNGTFVNGVRVKRRRLRHGDDILVGRTLMRYLDSTEDRLRGETEELEGPDSRELPAAA
jgi:pSer/pThr/pTyr-binding forkhead associated (FHA) protein